MRATGCDVFGSRLGHGRAAFFRLPDTDIHRLIALKTGVLIQDGLGRVLDLFMVGNLLVMCGAQIRLAQIGYARGLPLSDDQVLIRMRLFLATIVQDLFFRGFRPLAPTFGGMTARLIDGELSFSELRSMLATFDETPNGWKRLALGLLESEAFRRELRGCLQDRPFSPVREKVAEGRMRGAMGAISTFLPHPGPLPPKGEGLFC